MAKAVGEVIAKVGGQEYCLRLTMRSLATLQDEYGQALAPITAVKPGEIPQFGVCLRMIELALKKHHPEADASVADDIFTDDMEIIGRLLAATFPDIEDKSGGKPKATGA
jgi:hypothetical protein